jgi:hypothetical protein
MENTLIESRQLDRLFDEMLASRLNGGNGVASTSTASSALSNLTPASLPKPPQDPNVIPVLDVLEYCIEAKSPWGGIIYHIRKVSDI